MNDEIDHKKLIAMSSEEFDQMMVARFPEIFVNRHKSMMETCMCWGFDVGPGWYPILFDLCRKIESVSEMGGIVVVAEQVKQKYGSLRFYHFTIGRRSFPNSFKWLFRSRRDAKASLASEVVEDLVKWAETLSVHTCEECGDYGSLVTNNGWLSTLCKEHAAVSQTNPPEQQQV